MIRFHDNTIITKFVKNLIATTNIPTVDTWRSGDKVYSGCVYIADGYIVRAKITGYPKSIYDSDSNGNPYFYISDPYVFGKRYNCVTSPYISNINGYDSETHYYLGQYLRLLRDNKGVDLMPFYNCVNGRYISSHHIENGDLIIGNDLGSKVLSVPVRFNKVYTIAVDSQLPVQMICAIETPNGLKEIGTDSEKSYDIKTTYAKKIDAQFIKPFLYDKLLKFDAGQLIRNGSPLYQYNNYLRLLIQVPISDNSSVVVLEGDYTQTNPMYINGGYSYSEDIEKYTSGANFAINGLWSFSQVTSAIMENFYNKPFDIIQTGLYFSTKQTGGSWTDPDIFIWNDIRFTYDGKNTFIAYFRVNDSVRGTQSWYKVCQSTIDSGNWDTDINGRGDASIINTGSTYRNVESKFLSVLCTLATNSTQVQVNNPSTTEEKTNIIDNRTISQLGLLYLNDSHTYAFSDRLIEYLLENVITQNDEISQDIVRVQNYITSNKNYNKNGSVYGGVYSKGIWDDKMQKYLLDLALTSNKMKYPKKVDINGYVDKDVEYLVSD